MKRSSYTGTTELTFSSVSSITGITKTHAEASMDLVSERNYLMGIGCAE
jgi:hypothetical protein